MATRRIKPIYDKDKYSNPITEELSFHLWDLIYRPLIELLEDETGLDAKWNGSPVFFVPLSSLLPCPYNREIDENKKAKIWHDIKFTGEIKPLVVTEVKTDSGKELMITDGHHRYLALKELAGDVLSKDPMVPCIMADKRGTASASDEKKRAVNSKQNSKKGLIDALHGGKIQYRDGYFIGEFNASISKTIVNLGGTWDKNRKSFKISLDALPIEIKTAISASKQKTERIVSKLTAELDRIEEANESLESYKIPFGPDVDKVLNDLDVQFEKVTPDDLVITPKLDDATRDRLRGEYHENLNYYVKGWREEAIYRLRKQIDKNAFDGFRSKRMMETIQAEYGVSKNKAKFLARQETSLLVSAYRKSRYEKIGSWGYIWSTSHDVRVRHDHKRLDGKTFSWDDPPIVDQDTGRRAHPGQDFQCRCVALPLFDEQKGKLKERVKT